MVAIFLAIAIVRPVWRPDWAPLGRERWEGLVGALFLADHRSAANNTAGCTTWLLGAGAFPAAGGGAAATAATGYAVPIAVERAGAL